MSRRICPLVLLTVVALASPAAAQKKSCPTGSLKHGKFHAIYRPSARYGGLYGHHGAYGRHHAWGVGSAHAFYNHYPNRVHAYADLTRARGYASLRNAQALTELEVARRARLDNDVHALVTHYEKREINRDARFGDLYRRAAERKIDNAIQSAMSPKDAEQTLTASEDTNASDSNGLMHDELDPHTGRIHWPDVLSTTHYSKARKPIDELFRIRAEEGLIPTRHLTSIEKWLQKVIDEVDAREDLSHRQIAETVEFLNRLIHESRLPRNAMVYLDDLDRRIAAN